jgi:serine/threonine-protein kinase Chk1
MVFPSGTTQGSQTPLQRLVKRMTRFWVRTDIESTERELRDLFDMMNYGMKMTTPGILTVHTTDRSVSREIVVNLLNTLEFLTCAFMG